MMDPSLIVQAKNDGILETDDAPMYIPKDELKKAVEQTAKIKEKMAPPGMLRLPELLERRRLEYGIPDSAFRVQAAFNRLFIHKIEDVMFRSGRYGEDSRIELPDSTKKALLNMAPRGIIISAGLGALDTLRDHGMDVGHIVTINRVSPWRVIYDIIGGEQFSYLIVQDRDISGSEDTAEALFSRRLLLDEVTLPNGRKVALYKGRDGESRWIPRDTTAPEDM